MTRPRAEITRLLSRRDPKQRRVGQIAVTQDAPAGRGIRGAKSEAGPVQQFYVPCGPDMSGRGHGESYFRVFARQFGGDAYVTVDPGGRGVGFLLIPIAHVLGVIRVEIQQYAARTQYAEPFRVSGLGRGEGPGEVARDHRVEAPVGKSERLRVHQREHGRDTVLRSCLPRLPDHGGSQVHTGHAVTLAGEKNGKITGTGADVQDIQRSGGQLGTELFQPSAADRVVQFIFPHGAKIADSIRETARNLVGPGIEPDWQTLCSLVQLTPELAERYPRDLSGGQCQRFAIARAMAVQPRILLCDEITSALDVSSQAQILKLLDSLHRQKNMSVIFVSHDVAVVRSICDRVMVMHRGRVVEEGTAEAVIGSPREEYTKKLISSVLEVRT